MLKIFYSMVLFSALALLPGCSNNIRLTENNANPVTDSNSQVSYTDTPEIKEKFLSNFMESPKSEQVPNVIKLILDDTKLPKNVDTGWGNIYHQAATAMSQYAYKTDGVTLEKRGEKDYSFASDSGTANQVRLKEVHDNWLKWYENNQKKIQNNL